MQIHIGIAAFLLVLGAVSAEAELLRTDGDDLVAVDMSTPATRRALPLCARHMNFWCLKTPGPVYWLGQTGQDARNHAIFAEAQYGARAFFRLMHTYRFRHGLTTSNEIFGRYAPASDCIGSVPRNPATGACPRGENPTWIYARNIASALGLEPDDPIGLFISETEIDRRVAVELARGVVAFELGRGFTVSDDLIDAGLLLTGFSILDD